MKISIQIVLIMSLSFLLVASHKVSAELSANLGVVSQYHFRGIQQTNGASTSAGIDYEREGLGVGL